MSGTKAGAAKSKATIYQRHGKDFFKNIGRAGGLKSRTGGFTGDPQRAQLLAALGGMNRQRNEFATAEQKQDYLQRKQAVIDKIHALDEQRKQENNI